MSRYFLKSIITVLYVSVLIFPTGCLKDSDWEKFERQEEDMLDNFYNTLVQNYGEDAIQNIEVADIDQTGFFVNLTPGNETGVKPTEEDYVIIDFHGTYLNGDVYQTTYESQKSVWAFYNQFNYDHYLFASAKLDLAGKAPGLVAGLGMMNEGDSALLVLPSALFLNDFEHTPLAYTVKLHKVIKSADIQRYDSIQVDARIKQGFDTLADGVYYKVVDMSNSTDVKVNDTARINFSAFYFQEIANVNDSVLFETSGTSSVAIPADNLSSFVLNGYLSFPKGFSAVFDTLHFNEVVDVIITHPQAFGAGGLKHGTYGYQIIPPYTSLLYRVKWNSTLPGD